MLRRSLSLIFILAIVPLINSKQSTEDKITASVFYSKVSGKYTIKEGVYDTNAAAYATYTPAYETEGWDYLAVSSYTGNTIKYTDLQKSFAMGYLEGYITYKRIKDFYHNWVPYHYRDFNNQMPENVKSYLTDNIKYIETKARENKADPFWEQVINVFNQVKGVYEGFNSRVAQKDKISFIDFQLLSGFADIPELIYYKEKKYRPDFSKMSKNEILNYIDEHSHCSALIKIAPDFSDIWFGHNSWFGYVHMIRIFKEYRFISNSKTEKSKVVAFSSYPGALSSIDDFYITDQDMYITETTNEIFETSLYDLLKPESVLTYMRAIVANRLASNINEWQAAFAQENSGTYNNQYQVLDLKEIDIDKRLVGDNALLIVEQIPGEFVPNNQSEFLKRGYWPSYNNPFDTGIFEKSGYKKEIEDHPDMKPFIDYQTSSRANILRRDQGNVVDIESYKKLIYYNSYKTEPFANGDPTLTISARKDILEGERRNCYGMFDAKFSSIKDVKGKASKKIYIKSGPTTDGVDIFDWDTTKCGEGRTDTNHQGQNTKWNFSWVEYNTVLFDL